MKVKKPSPGTRKQVHDLIRFISVSFIITILLVIGKLYIEQTSFIHKYEVLAFEFLQTWIPPYGKQILPVVVLDSTSLEGGANENDVTPREKLMKLVNDVVKENPLAIAIDIDFSPGKDGWYATDEDPKFFNFCLDIKRDKQIPIFLGVDESRADHPDKWLNAARYKELAVALIVPRADTRRIPLWLEIENSPEKLPTLGNAVAQAYGKLPKRLPKWLARVIDMDENQRPSTEHHLEEEGYAYADILMNYSKLEAIDNTKARLIKLKPEDPNSELFIERRENLAGKLVIIGDVEGARGEEDNFIVPGYDQPVPGVYLHANAVYTLTTQPIYEFTYTVRILLDLLISGIIIFTVAIMRFRHRTEGDAYPWQERQKRFIKWAVIFVMIAGIILVRLLNVFWLDFGLVIAALLLHPTVEKGWHNLIKSPKHVPHSTIQPKEEV